MERTVVVMGALEMLFDHPGNSVSPPSNPHDLTIDERAARARQEAAASAISAAWRNERAIPLEEFRHLHIWYIKNQSNTISNMRTNLNGLPHVLERPPRVPLGGGRAWALLRNGEWKWRRKPLQSLKTGARIARPSTPLTRPPPPAQSSAPHAQPRAVARRGRRPRGRLRSRAPGGKSALRAGPRRGRSDGA